ncbi:MAG: VOC family protein [Gemmataceae bacterium]|nr:VOC family protein [Gemmataceae bacterium]
MPGIVGAHHTSFTVADLERSLAFFRDRLGLLVVSTREVGDDYFGRIVGLAGCRVRAALLRIPGSAHHVELFEYLRPPGQAYVPRPCDPGSAHLALLVDDLPALYQRLRAEGVAFVSEPVPIDAGPNAGGYGVYLRDPNGVLIELFQPPRCAVP